MSEPEKKEEKKTMQVAQMPAQLYQGIMSYLGRCPLGDVYQLFSALRAQAKIVEIEVEPPREAKKEEKK